MRREEVREREEAVLVRSVRQSVAPKLVAADAALFSSLLKGVFPSTAAAAAADAMLERCLRRVCRERGLLCGPPISSSSSSSSSSGRGRGGRRKRRRRARSSDGIDDRDRQGDISDDEDDVEDDGTNGGYFSGDDYDPLCSTGAEPRDDNDDDDDDVDTIDDDMFSSSSSSSSSSDNVNGNGKAGSEWLLKVRQLHGIQRLQHGVMMVGPAGSGKSSAWRVLLEALERRDRKEHGPQSRCHSYVIDPKAMSKEQLYGSMDATTMEWTDGVFTQTLRSIVQQEAEAAERERERDDVGGLRPEDDDDDDDMDENENDQVNAEGEEKDRSNVVSSSSNNNNNKTTNNSSSNNNNNNKTTPKVRHWIVFDGDVDPEWAENLNSVLDDNKILTLPSGERLAVPPRCVMRSMSV